MGIQQITKMATNAMAKLQKMPLPKQAKTLALVTTGVFGLGVMAGKVMFGDSFEKNKTEQIDHIKKLFEMHNKEYAEILNEINSIETTNDIEKSITLRNSLLKRLSSVKNQYEIVNAMLSRSSDENK